MVTYLKPSVVSLPAQELAIGMTSNRDYRLSVAVMNHTASNM